MTDETMPTDENVLNQLDTYGPAYMRVEIGRAHV